MRGTDEMELNLPAGAEEAMLAYLGELMAWNRAYNLTGVKQPLEMVAWHLLDSLSVAPFLHGESVADAGSGAGLPGIPLALACPGRRFTLLESRRKRVSFLRHVVRHLALENVEVAHTRVEDYHNGRGAFDSVAARALARLDALAPLCAPLCAPGGRILAMKGRAPAVELQALGENYTVQGVQRLQVPGLPGERHLLIISINASQASI